MADMTGHPSTVPCGLPVLRHRDHRRLKPSEHREHKVQQDVMIGIELVAAEQQTDFR